MSRHELPSKTLLYQFKRQKVLTGTLTDNQESPLYFILLQCPIEIRYSAEQNLCTPLILAGSLVLPLIENLYAVWIYKETVRFSSVKAYACLKLLVVNMH